MILRILALLLCEFLLVTAMPGAGGADLVAYYPLNGNGLDASGNNHHASEVLATATSGRFGGAYFFTGSEDSFIAVPHTSAFNINPNQGFTIAFWVLLDPSATSNQYVVVDYNQGWKIEGYGGDPAEPTSPHPLWFSVGTDTGFEGIFAAPPVGQWHHVAWKFESVKGQYALSGFLDGYSESYLTFEGNMMEGAGDLYFGKSGLGAADPFIGYLDEVRIFNTALSDNEILAVSQLNPVPLPTSLLLLGPGLLMLAAGRRFWS